ncbi:Phosphoglycerate dehydrogenase [Paenibacillus sp. UNCCL117]|uniref:D-2-hydroxyacid dehydrogenase family protein n=1 Tax=unclassified Paenibacillus TaxID=185978 RepID=UPI00088642FE|nr:MULTISPECIES: D-2-hydroxyacid dehydrogenase family protein [unclassified Paenibacillus]SDE46170.1 Phosphoglycerate dehydrogenase [Paenibacillus sp. cl123]SFW65911.1 Phosphoglycerate dehydrogenase [Paenibacillus sp. UNCCL117]
MKLTCAILDDYQDAALRLADWSAVTGQVELRTIRDHIGQEEELVQAIGDCDIIVAMRERTPFPASLLVRLPKLKLLITTGMRNASIDLAAAREQGIVVCGTGTRSEPPVELAWALILGLARHVVQENNAFRESGPWQSTLGADLHGSTLGLLGLGKLGSRMARIGQAFGMETIAWSQNLTREQAEASGARLAASKEELLAASDFLSVHLVLSERTRGLIGAAELACMKPSAYLINTSRAPIVDQSALIAALQEGRIAGAGLDVFDPEPLPEDHALRKLKNVLATPHIGYVTEGNYRVYFEEAVEDIAAYLAGAPIRRLN